MATAYQTFDAASTALKDIIKFKIIQYVNTGDKTLDSLINTFLVTLLTLIFTLFSYQTLLVKYYIWKSRKSKLSLDQKTIEYYTQLMKSSHSEFTYVTWIINESKESKIFTSKFINYFISHCGWKVRSNKTFMLNTKTLEISGLRYGDKGIDLIRNILAPGEETPIYIDNHGVVGICKNSNNDILLLFNNKLTCDNFIKNINAMPDPEFEKEKNSDEHKEIRQLNIYYHDTNQVIGFIYEDRNFDMFISRHKQTVLNKIESFQKANNSKSTYGGYSSYNLGFILYGKPGTGKTLFIKAVCNKLQRDARIVDMRLIKTRSDFENIFINYKKCVYVLDEFDCIQGVIRNRDAKNDEIKIDPLSELRERQMSILSLMSNRSAVVTKQNKHEDEEVDPLMIELNHVKKQIKEIENGLTLDTILTVLEGMCEMRGRVIIATTNYIDRIDSALLREGRFDEKIELTPFNTMEIREMLHKMFDNSADKDDLDRLDRIDLKEDIYTPTALIGLASKHRSLGAILDIIEK